MLSSKFITWEMTELLVHVLRWIGYHHFDVSIKRSTVETRHVLWVLAQKAIQQKLSFQRLFLSEIRGRRRNRHIWFQENSYYLSGPRHLRFWQLRDQRHAAGLSCCQVVPKWFPSSTSPLSPLHSVAVYGEMWLSLTLYIVLKWTRQTRPKTLWQPHDLWQQKFPRHLQQRRTYHK